LQANQPSGTRGKPNNLISPRNGSAIAYDPLVCARSDPIGECANVGKLKWTDYVCENAAVQPLSFATGKSPASRSDS
jgi:hypothetical protein